MLKTILKIRNNRWFCFYCTCLILTFGLIQWARAEEYTFKHNLDEYIKYALAHNPMINAADQMIAMKQEEKKLMRKIPDPTVVAMFMEELDADGFGLGKVTVSQMFPWPGKLASKRRVADKTISTMEYKKIDKEVMLVFNVRKAYVSLYAVGKKIEYSKQSLELLKQMESVMLAKYASAMGSQMALLKLQVKMAMIENLIINMEEMGKKIRYMLEAMLNTPAALDFPFPDTLPLLKVPKQEEDVREIAILNNPLVLKHKEQVQEAEAMVRMAKQMYAPNLMISGTYARAEYDMSNMGAMMSMSGPTEELKGGFGFGLGLAVPIWTRINKARVNKARSMVAAEKARLKNEELVISKDASMFLVELDDAERQIALLDNVLIPKAQQALELVMEMYKIGNASILDFLHAEKTLLDLQIKRVDQLKKREITAGEIVICCLAKY